MPRRQISFDTKPTDRIRHLIYERPEWGPILQECLRIWKEVGTSFAGSWVYKAVEARDLTPPSNLRLGVRYGVLEVVGRTRSGKRAYYQLTNPAALDRVLREIYPPKKRRYSDSYLESDI